jgi:hypothetical protein
MSYIGLFNETDITTDTATVDTIVINTNLSSLGTNKLNNTTLTGSLTGFTTVGEGETIFSYTPSTRTFNISTPVNSIDPTKLIAGDAGQIIQTNDLNDAVWVDLSGDAIINANGVMTVDKSRTVLMASTTVNGNYNLLFRTGTTNGYNTLYNQVNITYNPSTQTFTTTNGIFNGLLSVIGGINIPNGQTYKINNVEYLITKTTDNLTQGTTNKYYASSLFNTDLATKTTNDLLQGTTNKYYATSLFNTDLATKTTTNLTEGTNLYFTDTRVRLAFNTTATTEITNTYNSSTGNLQSNINNGSILLTKLNTGGGTIGQCCLINALGNPVFSNFNLSNLPNGTAQYQVIMTGATPFNPSYQSLTTTFITQGTNKYLNALSTTNTTEITHI